MAYTTGSGSVTLDFMTALKNFASGIGWTIANFDTTNKRLYMSSGLCNVCLGWETNNITDYTSGSPVSVTEGIIYGTLCETIGSGNNFYTFAGSAASTSSVNDSGNIVMSYMQGSFPGWWFFSNAGGTYIHAIVQVAADRYRWLIMGNGNNDGLSHSGSAYLASDGGDQWYKTSTGDTVPWQPQQFSCLSLRWQAQRFGSTSTLVLFTANSLPSPFTNNIAFGSGFEVLQGTKPQFAMPLTSDSYNNANSYYPGGGPGNCNQLLDYISGMQGPEWAAAIPMAGCPLAAVISGQTSACMIGTIPDFRLIDLTNLAPQQEIAVSSDTWQVFPLMRQQQWSLSGTAGPTSGQRGFALKVIT